MRFDVIVIADEFRYRDGFDYRYDNLEEGKNALKSAVNDNETQNGWYTDLVDCWLRTAL